MENNISIPGVSINPEYNWFEGHITLQAWSGFQSRQGWYGAIDKEEPSDGTVQINIECDKVNGTPVLRPAQLSAYKYVTENQESMKQAILERLLKEYPEIQQQYNEDYNFEESIPDVSSPDDFKNLMGLIQVHIINVIQDGTACVGYEFGCIWEDHGYGVMTHKDRILSTGHADESFEEWMAKRALKGER